MEIVDSLIQTYKSKLDIFDSFMNEGLSNEEIAELQKYLNVQLPEAYTYLLKKYNGEKKILCCMAFGFCSINEVKSNWNFFKKQSIDLCLPEDVYQKDKIRNILYSELRIPFAHDGSGQFLCIDFIPNHAGNMGQIIYLPCGEPEPICVIANNFEDFIEFLISSLQTGKLELIDERADYEEDEQELAIDDIHFQENWKDDWTDIAQQRSL